MAYLPALHTRTAVGRRCLDRGSRHGGAGTVTATGRAQADKLIFWGVRWDSRCPPWAIRPHHSLTTLSPSAGPSPAPSVDAHPQAQAHARATSPLAGKCVPGRKHAIANSAPHKGTGLDPFSTPSLLACPPACQACLSAWYDERLRWTWTAVAPDIGLGPFTRLRIHTPTPTHPHTPTTYSVYETYCCLSDARLHLSSSASPQPS